ncbi:MAG: LamB/YcsF family protein [Spirochaetes bacterium]|nr:LamB/YcsF family protein [Spirochaetota bacterium]
MPRIDLNCDMGESFGVYVLGHDEDALPFVTSINAACGFHASDPQTMQKIVGLAKKHGVAVGAHPGYPDLVGFGRRELAASPDEIEADVIYQIGALDAFCRAEGMKLQHVKPHGALYNRAEKDLSTALAIARAVRSVNPALYLVCLANSPMVEAAKQVGIPYVEEAFADRAYTADGKLVSRKVTGSVIHNVDLVAERVMRMVVEGKVRAIDGTELSLRPDTICVHGDTPGAVNMIKAIRARLALAGVEVRAFGNR